MPTEEKVIVQGRIVEGVVQGITKFGAFVELDAGVVGLVHISEIADTYVNDVRDFLDVGNLVRVRVLNVSDGKIGLSIKQAIERPPRRDHANLEDKLNRFFKESDERQQSLKMKQDARRK
ncbi:MAG: S1 RNA-binding domain-containing protein [Solirubrobacterales bacterium]